MFKKILDEYLLIKNESKENKSNYYKVGLISLIISCIFIFLWVITTILIFSINNGLLQATLLILSFLLSYIINPVMLLSSILFLVLQWKIYFNKFTLFALISNILLFSTIIISIFIF
ncbi:MAG: hypothetical protein E7177_07455 [Erysipelotrichaceae bacterium]|nr:hypothetical protein [Erysipelotrichaceae bacterium]